MLVLGGVALTIAGRWLWGEYHFRAGRQALERRDYAGGRGHLRKCLAVWPRGPATHLLAARAAVGVGAYAEAERHLDASEELGGERQAIRLERHLLDAQRGTLSPLAEELLHGRVGQSGPETGRILEALIFGYLYTYRLGEAQACLARWLALEPENAQALYLRGLVREGLQQLPEAGADYRRAVEIDPNHAAARQRLAEFLLHEGQGADAAEQFERLHSTRPDDPAVLFGLARAWRQVGKLAEARNLLDRLLADHPDHLGAVKLRGQVAFSDQDPARAERCYRKALQLDASDTEACYGMARALVARDRRKEADGFLERGRAIERDLAQLRELHEKIGREPGNAQLRYEAGLICLRNGQQDEGRRWLLSALRIDRHHQPAQRALEGAR